MKILNIRFCNLNSLAGTWFIDLTSPEYLLDGIFAITGTTGAGKTTILDAMCLALYGRTPRLEKVTKSSNEVMTRQTGLCWAEVEFSTAKGRFRCHWSQHRARKSPAGDLQPQKHEIVDCASNTPLETKLKMVEKKVVEVTGMDYDQFTRSILLAQGDFNTFLKANPDDRAPILEQITGTEIYSRISKKVHERRAEEQTKLALLSLECDGFLPLGIEALDTIHTRLKELQTLSAGVDQQVNGHRKLLDWYERQEQLQNKINTGLQHVQQLEQQWLELSPKREQRHAAEKSRPLVPVYSRLQEQQALQNSELKELTACRLFIKDLDPKIIKNTTQLNTTEHQLTTLKESQISSNITLKKVRTLDQQLNDLLQQRTTLENELEQTAKKNNQLNIDQTKSEKAIQEEELTLKKIEGYQKASACDSKLVEEFSGILQQINLYVEQSHKHKATAQQIRDAQNAEKQCLLKIHAQKTHTQELRVRHDSLLKKEQECRSNVQEMLQGISLDQLFHKESEEQKQFHSLEQASNLANQLQQHTTQIAALQKDVEKVEAETATALNKKDLSHKTVLTREEQVEKQEKIVLLAAKITSLETERNALKPGTPCPLCGSPEHPYRLSEIPQESDEKLQLHKDKAKLHAAREEFSKIQAEIAAFNARSHHIATELQNQKRMSDECRQALSEKCRLLGINVDSHLVNSITARMQNAQCAITELQAIRTKAEKHNGILSETVRQLQEVTRLSNDAELKMQGLVNAGDKCTEHIEKLKESSIKEIEKLNLLTENLSTVLNGFTDLSLSLDNHQEIMQTLRKKRDLWLRSVEKLQSVSQNILKDKSALSSQQLLIKQLEERAATCNSNVLKIKTVFETLQKERFQLMGSDDPDVIEQNIAKEISATEHTVTNLRLTANELQQQHAIRSDRASSLQERTDDRTANLQKALTDFNAKLVEAGFANTEQFLSSIMEEDSLNQLVQYLNEQQKRMEEVNTILKADKALLNELHDQKLTEVGKEELISQMNDYLKKLSALQQETGALNQQLLDNQRQQEIHKQKIEQMKSQQQEVDRWSRLHELIGSNDGKKFRNFAQGLTFEIMIGHANMSLQKMTDRYLLIRDPAQPLELQVIDNYQAGEMRSTKNLSGGESFIVSMALALGLSNMASHNVQVDSLFLDEGFGTLDDESLQTALDTLGGLHQEGKLIGVISHVKGLQERIATQIKVTRGAGGLSTLSGPGAGRWKEPEIIEQNE